jgi:hypothetical protein
MDIDLEHFKIISRRCSRKVSNKSLGEAKLNLSTRTRRTYMAEWRCRAKLPCAHIEVICESGGIA